KVSSCSRCDHGVRRRDEHAILADPGVQWNFLCCAAVSGGQRTLAHFRRDADRQPLAWVLLPFGRICRAISDLDHGLVGAVASACGALDRRSGLADGTDFPAAPGIRSTAAGAADG